jgi:uncharacterized RDD family membrane protein YckC
MQSTEPNESRFVNDPNHPAAGDETWRAEVASRVNSYRARRKCKSGSEDSPALDFGPTAEARSFEAPAPKLDLGTPNLGIPGARVQAAEARSTSTSARIAFDTNYYRRLNAESMAQGPNVTMGATATAPALEPDFVFETEGDAGAQDEARDETPDEFNDDLMLDLEIRPSVAEDAILKRYRISEPEPDLPIAAPEPPPVAQEPAPVAQGNLIVFRRPLLEPPLLPKPSRDELAEPMNNRPRILEVPEDIMPAVQGSLFPEIRLDADEQETSHQHEPEIEVPLRVALVSERLLASLTDVGVVMAASLLFAGMAWHALPDVPHAKTFWMVLGAVTLLLWAVYQHLFLLCAGRTLGMSFRGIRLSTFDGRVPEWEERSNRARSMVISFAPVALGFLWALVDEDTLCWHDRISQTFPTTE